MTFLAVEDVGVGASLFLISNDGAYEEQVSRIIMTIQFILNLVCGFDCTLTLEPNRDRLEEYYLNREVEVEGLLLINPSLLLSSEFLHSDTFRRLFYRCLKILEWVTAAMYLSS